MAQKTRRVEGIGTIVTVGSSCVGNMAWETPYAIIALGGERFRYQSDRVAAFELQKDDIVKVKMLVKQNGNVWRFTLIRNFTDL